jgi:hypothetical protein
MKNKNDFDIYQLFSPLFTGACWGQPKSRKLEVKVRQNNRKHNALAINATVEL